MKKRYLITLLALLLCVLIIPGRAKAGELETSYVALNADSRVDWILQEDLYLNLNGYTLTGVITTNGYKIYGIDSATDTYTAQNMGYFNCTDDDGNAIVPESYVFTNTSITGFSYSYMTVPTEAGYTFHRFYVGISHTSLKPTVTGVGYKALFRGDEMVKSQLDADRAFRYGLQLSDMTPVYRYVSGQSLTSGSAISLRVANWDVENHGQTPICAWVGLQLKDGTWINSAAYSFTLRQQVESISSTYEDFEPYQLQAVRSMIRANPTMQTWDVGELFFAGYAPVDVPQTGKAYKLAVQIPGGNYYFSGSTSSYFLATDIGANLSTDVYLEAVNGGYALYFMKGSVKTYIDVAYYSASSGTMVLTSGTTAATYKLNTQHKYLYTTVNSETYYLGTYSSGGSTIRASSTSYISDTSKIGVSQFPAWFYEPVYDFGEEEDTTEPCPNHTDTDDNGKCDQCNRNVTVIIDLYAINDLHGKLVDGDSHPGVDELSTYIKNARATRDNVILLSSGDMWQGAAESNLTKGMIITDWMNEMDFVSMTMGNHEYDWGREIIEKNEEFAQFPFLGINVYDRSTLSQVDYCQSSVVVEMDGVQVGIIGAIGDCYSSISPDKCQDVYFVTGTQLTNLVKAEATRLREAGVDFVVLSVHDNDDNYDEALSNGYVDLVFEGHSHSRYVHTDAYGVYHLQGGGDNSGISYATVSYNTANGNSKVTTAATLKTNVYSSLSDDPLVELLLQKYDDQVSLAYEVLGTNPSKMDSTEILQTVADLYRQAGEQRWGSQYNIVLGGGYLSCRSPYDLAAGQVTYGDLLDILPFDNRLVLCRIKGSDLKSRFINTTNTSYYISYTGYGNTVKNSIQDSSYYYVLVDTYSAYYAPNKLTVVEFYDDHIYARDLLAQYIREGNL